MTTYPVPPEEHERLAALYRYNVLDTPVEEASECITRLAATLFQAPIAYINLVDKERQWTKSCYGRVLREIGRDVSFCTHAIMADEVMVVLDATLDRRFSHNPLVGVPEGIRFYAGAPLKTRDNFKLGTLCVIDTEPRLFFSETERKSLRDLASLVMDKLELRLTLERAKEEISVRQKLEQKLSVSRQALLQTNTELQETQRKLHGELEHAAVIQRDLLPPTGLALPGFELAARFQPAREISGDFYDWQLISPNCVTFSLGDVTGKGVPAALLMTTVLAAMRSVVRDSPPLEAIKYVSKVLERHLERAGKLITLFLGQLDASTGCLRYVDAGHGHVVMSRWDGTLERLTERSLPLGVSPHTVRREEVVHFGHGDTLIVYSDGLLRGQSEASYQFPMLTDALYGARNAEEIIERLVGKNTDLEDDLTVLVLHCQR